MSKEKIGAISILRERLTSEFISKLNVGQIIEVIEPDAGYTTYFKSKDGKLVLLSDNLQEMSESLKNVEKAKIQSNVDMNLYDLNKQVVSQIEPMTEDKIKEVIKEFKELNPDTYYLLYGKEISYFTLFHSDSIIPECENLESGVIECLENVGIIYSADLTENKDAVEIWVRQGQEPPTVMYLFAYGTGIVTIGK